MPLINFTCNRCGEEFGSFRRTGDETEAGPPCPACGDPKTLRQQDSIDAPSCNPAAGTGTVR